MDAYQHSMMILPYGNAKDAQEELLLIVKLKHVNLSDNVLDLTNITVMKLTAMHAELAKPDFP